MSKQVYFFSQDKTEGDASLKNTLGGKGANLAEMASLGLPVPPGFTLATSCCVSYFDNDGSISDVLKQEVRQNLSELEKVCGKKLGDAENPLLVSVRSGARVSMPGMMDTVLNLGLNDISVKGLAAKSKNGRFALDSYRRFIQMYGNVVLDVDHYDFENILHDLKDESGIELDSDLTEVPT